MIFVKISLSKRTINFMQQVNQDSKHFQHEPKFPKSRRKSKVLLSYGITNTIAKRNQDSDSIRQSSLKNSEFPKLKGGGKKPKVLLTDDIEIEHELTILRSLDLLTEEGDHKKCELTKYDAKTNLCMFCLLRSTVIRSRKSKGRTKIQPIEFLCMENIHLEGIYQCIKDASPKLADKIMIDWGCTTCSIEDEDIYLDFSFERYEGKDLYRLMLGDPL